MIRIAVLLISILVAGCQAGDPAKPRLTCNSTSDPEGEIADINTLLYSMSDNFSPAVPLDFRLRLAVSVNSVTSGSEVAEARLFFPDGTSELLSGNLITSTSPPYFDFFFGQWLGQSDATVRRVPMDGYCLALRLSDDSRITYDFNIEQPDGSEPAAGSDYLHPNESASLGVGDELGLGLASVTDLTVSTSPDEVSFKLAVSDSRVSYFELIFANDLGIEVATFTYMPTDPANLDKTGAATLYTFSPDTVSTEETWSYKSGFDSFANISAMQAILYDTPSPTGPGYMPDFPELGSVSNVALAL